MKQILSLFQVIYVSPTQLAGLPTCHPWGSSRLPARKVHTIVSYGTTTLGGGENAILILLVDSGRLPRDDGKRS
jgi:hypothetical protein